MIGIYGGTLDPIHFGHLRPALELLQGLPLQQVRFIPCGVPPHRGAPVASGEARLAMVQAAIADQAGFVADDREVRRAGPSYMVDTLQSLRAEFGDTPLGLILGMDAFVKLDSWHQWQRIPELANLIVTTRPGWPAEQALAQAPQAIQDLVRSALTDTMAGLARRPAGGILITEVTQLDISATRIRALIKQGRSPRYLLPDAVWRLLEQNGFYQDRKSA